MLLNNQAALSRASICVKLITLFFLDLENDLIIIARYLDDDLKITVKTLFKDVKREL